MKMIQNIEVLGDSILKGIQVNPVNKRYYTKNDIDIPMLSQQFSLEIKNDSYFGCTVTKGAQILNRKLERGLCCDAVVMDFGGNDCDFNWKDISDNPNRDFQPNTPLPIFLREYREIIHLLKEKGIIPIITTLPPLEPQRFFEWWCGSLNRENVMKWLGSVSAIFYHQENYSKHIERLAKEENVMLVDIRREFLKFGNVGKLMCEDGTHPNSLGQQVITEAFYKFIKDRRNERLQTA